jgi:hypothetical protein
MCGLVTQREDTSQNVRDSRVPYRMGSAPVCRNPISRAREFAVDVCIRFALCRGVTHSPGSLLDSPAWLIGISPFRTQIARDSPAAAPDYSPPARMAGERGGVLAQEQIALSPPSRLRPYVRMPTGRPAARRFVLRRYVARFRTSLTISDLPLLKYRVPPP